MRAFNEGLLRPRVARAGVWWGRHQTPPTLGAVCGVDSRRGFAPHLCAEPPYTLRRSAWRM